MWHEWLAVAKEEILQWDKYISKRNWKGQKDFGGNENQQYDIWGGNKEILIINKIFLMAKQTIYNSLISS